MLIDRGVIKYNNPLSGVSMVSSMYLAVSEQSSRHLAVIACHNKSVVLPGLYSKGQSSSKPKNITSPADCMDVEVVAEYSDL